MVDASRPVEKKIIDAVERMKRVQDAARGLKEERQRSLIEDAAAQRQPGNR